MLNKSLIQINNFIVFFNIIKIFLILAGFGVGTGILFFLIYKIFNNKDLKLIKRFYNKGALTIFNSNNNSLTFFNSDEMNPFPPEDPSEKWKKILREGLTTTNENVVKPIVNYVQQHPYQILIATFAVGCGILSYYLLGTSSKEIVLPSNLPKVEEQIILSPDLLKIEEEIVLPSDLVKSDETIFKTYQNEENVLLSEKKHFSDWKKNITTEYLELFLKFNFEEISDLNTEVSYQYSLKQQFKDDILKPQIYGYLIDSSNIRIDFFFKEDWSKFLEKKFISNKNKQSCFVNLQNFLKNNEELMKSYNPHFDLIEYNHFIRCQTRFAIFVEKGLDGTLTLNENKNNIICFNKSKTIDFKLKSYVTIEKKLFFLVKDNETNTLKSFSYCKIGEILDIKEYFKNWKNHINFSKKNDLLIIDSNMLPFIVEDLNFIEYGETYPLNECPRDFFKP